MLASMAKTTGTKAGTKRTGKAATKAPEGRGKSLLVEAGEERMREVLLKTLRESGWNLTATAEALRMSAASSVIRAIHNLGLDEEYERAREKGHVRPGARPRD